MNFVGSRGDIAARYGGLTAVDATGRHLPSALSVKNGRVLISVNDHGARYPLTIDPLVQQAPKLVPPLSGPTGENGDSGFGQSVALSADGNTVLVGGPQDMGAGSTPDLGAAWVFTRSGSTWSLQQRLLPNDPAPNSSDFGVSVALSSNGNVALIGGDFDNMNQGAAWVFTRSGSTWAQQGTKLTGAGGGFGASVALSSDGTVGLDRGAADVPGWGDLGLYGIDLDANAAWAVDAERRQRRLDIRRVGGPIGQRQYGTDRWPLRQQHDGRRLGLRVQRHDVGPEWDEDRPGR